MAEPDNQSEPVSSTSTTRTKGQGRGATPRKAVPPDAEDLIRQAEDLQTALRDCLGRTSQLIKSIKQQQRQRRMLQSTLQSLRELKTLGI